MSRIAWKNNLQKLIRVYNPKGVMVYYFQVPSTTMNNAGQLSINYLGQQEFVSPSIIMGLPEDRSSVAHSDTQMFYQSAILTN